MTFKTFHLIKQVFLNEHPANTSDNMKTLETQKKRWASIVEIKPIVHNLIYAPQNMLKNYIRCKVIMCLSMLLRVYTWDTSQQVKSCMHTTYRVGDPIWQDGSWGKSIRDVAASLGALIAGLAGWLAKVR